ncbi:MAG: Ig-like domain-containing protein [Vicinamibacteria bacterium]|nr:Ig-like domain-containing protein [Vicinamibacteria bacterium]
MMRLRHYASVVLVVLVVLAADGNARAQDFGDLYSQIYGEPIDVSVKDLAFGVVPFTGRAVRTKGYVEIDLDSSGDSARRYLLQDEGFRITIVPRPEAASAFSFDGISLLGKRVAIVGLFETNTGTQSAMFTNTGQLEFWRWTVLDVEKRKLEKAQTVSLEALVAHPDKYSGRVVRLTGEFRGRNLYGDLPSRSFRHPSDWVVRDASHSVWITGKKPEGKGWSLNAQRKRDTGKWLIIVGRSGVHDGIAYVRASSVSLTSAPRRRQPERNAIAAPDERPRRPPVVVFSLPLDGERDVTPTTSIAVQFSKDMDPHSFSGRILVRYAGPRRIGDMPFDYVRLEYDQGRRALRIDPGDALQSGREVELLLLPGIRDREGLELIPRAGRRFDNAVDVIRYIVGG